MKNTLLLFLIISLIFSCNIRDKNPINAVANHRLEFNRLAQVWDEAMPNQAGVTQRSDILNRH